MRIRKLILENVGLFRGRTEIDLAPRRKYGKTRPVVLVGGTNGAGKTTILDSIRLCLYGPLAVGERVSLDEYHRYLRGCLHRSETTLLKSQSASVGMEFEFGIGGKLDVYFVERSWDCSPSSVLMNLSVTRNGQPLDELERKHADEFLRDLIPRGVSQLFFFDGEKIQEMAQANDDDEALTEAIRELLGLDMVSRLRTDLSVYVSRQSESNAPKALKKELQKLDEAISRLQLRQLELTKNLDQSQSKEDQLKKEIAGIETRFSRKGGAFADQRASLKAEETHLKDAIGVVEKSIRDLADDLLPFTLATQLCQSLRDQLAAESTVRDWQAHQKLVQERIAGIKSSLQVRLFPKSDKTKITNDAKQSIEKRVHGLLDTLAASPKNLPKVPLVHNLSDSDQTQVLNAITRVVDEVPKQVRSLEASYEKSMRRLLQVKSELEKVPEDEVLEPLLQKLNDLNRKLGKAESSKKQAKEDLTSVEHEIVIQTRLRKKKVEELRVSEKGAERHEMVTRVQAVLDEYAASLTKSKMADLSVAVADCFGQLWRKGDSLHSIKIVPETCTVMLLDKSGKVIPKDRLSAGEKQIYAISMLWALAKVSGRVLPMVIDTPLARLDSKHRRHLVTRYFPHVSHQVIILSTDTEIDQTYFEELGPSISHAYHLRYDDADAKTVVEEGYFWSRREAEAVQ